MYPSLSDKQKRYLGNEDAVRERRHLKGRRSQVCRKAAGVSVTSIHSQTAKDVLEIMKKDEIRNAISAS